MKRFLAFTLLGCATVAIGCEPPLPVGIIEGGVCAEVGKTSTLDDECNSCTCESNRTWACTHRLCECTPGASKPADDGCNVCSCTPEGRWICTLMACHIDPCAEGQKTYQDARALMVTKAQALGCTTNADCTLLYEHNRCATNCGAAWPTSIVDAVSTRLEGLAEANCSACPDPVIPPCIGVATQCVEGTCSVGPMRP